MLPIIVFERHIFFMPINNQCAGCSEDPDVKGTETLVFCCCCPVPTASCSEDPDVKGTETDVARIEVSEKIKLQRGSRCKGN